MSVEGDNSDRIDELCTFFERNPHIRSFSCDSNTFMSNKEALLNPKVKLDTFELKNHFLCKDLFEEKSLWNLLHQLHEYRTSLFV